MNKETIFEIWAPEAAIWSPWAKPVLFAHLDSVSTEIPALPELAELTWAPFLDAGLAIVVDVPGAEGVRLGIALAHRGFRPVPLYNAVPLPSSESTPDRFCPPPSLSAVDVVPTVAALRYYADALAAIKLPANAPPAFLLDANRHARDQVVKPTDFDNRSVCFTTDFPSANVLVAQGIKKVLLVQGSSLQPQRDLAHILRRWQDAGLALQRLQLDSPGAVESFHVFRPSWYGAMFQRALAAFGLRRADGEGFGSWLNDSASGG